MMLLMETHYKSSTRGSREDAMGDLGRDEKDREEEEREKGVRKDGNLGIVL